MATISLTTRVCINSCPTNSSASSNGYNVECICNSGYIAVLDPVMGYYCSCPSLNTVSATEVNSVAVKTCCPPNSTPNASAICICSVTYVAIYSSSILSCINNCSSTGVNPSATISNS